MHGDVWFSKISSHGCGMGKREAVIISSGWWLPRMETTLLWVSSFARRSLYGMRMQFCQRPQSRFKINVEDVCRLNIICIRLTRNKNGSEHVFVRMFSKKRSKLANAFYFVSFCIRLLILFGNYWISVYCIVTFEYLKRDINVFCRHFFYISYHM